MTQQNATASAASPPEPLSALAEGPLVPVMGRKVAILGEVALIILIAYLLVNAFYMYVTPTPDFKAAIAAENAQNITQTQQVSCATITEFDPFYRETAVVAATTDTVPESSLDVTIAGLRAGLDGDGSAIIDVQGSGQKLVKVGDAISPGITLTRIYADRIEISRLGIRETVYMTKPSITTSNGAAATAAQDSISVDDALAGQVQAVSRGLEVTALLQQLRFEPVRDRVTRRISGFRITAETPQALLSAAGLEAGDVIRAVNGSPLTSFERMQELGEELKSASNVTVDIDRRGEQISLTL